MASETPLHIVSCTEARHAQALLAIFNHEIAHSTALYEYQPRSLAMMSAWFDGKVQGGWPVIAAEDDTGRLLGFASYGPFRAYQAFKYTVEHSVYVQAQCQSRGVGRALMAALTTLAEQHQVHVMVGTIDSANLASIALHERLGFSLAGALQQTGYKFGRWLDLLFYQRILATPAHPGED